MWTGVAIISIAVVVVGSSMFGSADSRRRLSEASSDDEAPVSDGSSELFKGLLFTVGGTIMQSLPVRIRGEGDGRWRRLPHGSSSARRVSATLPIAVVYPIPGLVPGPDHGVYEDFDTMAKLQDNPNLRAPLGVILRDRLWLLVLGTRHH